MELMLSILLEVTNQHKSTLIQSYHEQLLKVLDQHPKTQAPSYYLHYQRKCNPHNRLQANFRLDDLRYRKSYEGLGSDHPRSESKERCVSVRSN